LLQLLLCFLPGRVLKEHALLIPKGSRNYHKSRAILKPAKKQEFKEDTNVRCGEASIEDIQNSVFIDLLLCQI
jgi:hypothetical protein